MPRCGTGGAAGQQVKRLTLLFSEGQLALPDLADLILWEADRQDLCPTSLGIALRDLPGVCSESTCTSWITSNLTRLSAAGCQVELDEFGFGKINPGAGAGFDGNLIRIGRGLIHGCDHGLPQQRMILAVLALAERRGMSTIALDVTSRTERSFLTQIGVNLLQGNVIGPALSQDAFRHMLQGHHGPTPVTFPLRRAG